MWIETGTITSVFSIGVMAGLFLAIMIDWFEELIAKLVARFISRNRK